MHRKLILLIAALALSNIVAAQTDTTDSFKADSTVLVAKPLLNDYSMIGFSCGATFNHILFTPSQSNAWPLRFPHASITYTKYTKLFGYLPYFGLTVSANYGTEGYRFDENEKGEIYLIEGANEVLMKYVEVPMLAQFHYDMEFFKIMASLGLYGGYRLSIERSGPLVTDEFRYSFKDTDIRWDYGLQGGVGFAFVFDPFEIQINGMLRYSWSSIYKPETFSQYYYRYAYPFDIIVTAGLHIHFQPRWGATRKELRRQAYEKVYGKNENN